MSVREYLMVIVGRVKIPINDLFLLTKKEIDALVRGHEIDREEDFERQRASAFLICSPYLKKGTNIQSFWPLPWDEGYKPKKLDPEELRKDTLKAKERFKKLKMMKENG